MAEFGLIVAVFVCIVGLLIGAFLLNVFFESSFFTKIVAPIIGIILIIACIISTGA